MYKIIANVPTNTLQINFREYSWKDPIIYVPELKQYMVFFPPLFMQLGTQENTMQLNRLAQVRRPLELFMHYLPWGLFNKHMTSGFGSYTLTTLKQSPEAFLAMAKYKKYVGFVLDPKRPRTEHLSTIFFLNRKELLFFSSMTSCPLVIHLPYMLFIYYQNIHIRMCIMDFFDTGSPRKKQNPWHKKLLGWIEALGERWRPATGMSLEDINC